VSQLFKLCGSGGGGCGGDGDIDDIDVSIHTKYEIMTIT
jgi:hypothetical protein